MHNTKNAVFQWSTSEMQPKLLKVSSNRETHNTKNAVSLLEEYLKTFTIKHFANYAKNTYQDHLVFISPHFDVEPTLHFLQKWSKTI